MKDLNYQLSKLCRDNRDGGFSTQATRSRILDLVASQLQGLGYRRMQPSDQRQLRNASMSKLHGLRHSYAQRRYFELTGWRAPVAGGPTSKQLTPEQLAPDYDARAMISRELGHARAAISAVYLGR